jgi:DNA polymerase-1
MDHIPLVAWNGLLVVGELPNRDEVRRGVPLTGGPGHLFKGVLEHLHATSEATHFTYAIRCNTTSGAKPSDEALKLARKCCVDQLDETVLTSRPKAILTLGATALESATGLTGVEKYRGATTTQTFKDVNGEELDVPVVSTIHPAAMLRAPEKHPWFDMFLSDVEKALLLANGRREPMRPVVQAFTLKAVLEALGDGRQPVAVDLETNGIDIRECGITTVGLARMTFDEDTGEETAFAVSIPCPGLRTRFATAEWRKAWALLRKVFLDKKREWVFHNMAFDVPVIERNMQLRIAGKCHDTLLAHHAIYPKTPHDLQAVSTHFFCVEPWKAFYAKRFESVKDSEIPELLYYNGADTSLTIQLHHKLSHELRRENVLNVYENDRVITKYAMDWEKVGVGVDEEVRLRLHYQFEAEIEDLLKQLRDMVGDEGFNPNSSKQLQPILVDQFQLIPKKVTKTGQLSTDEKSLFEFRDHPFVELLQIYRTKTKLFSTYIEGLARKIGQDGRIHPRWNKTATPSGRFGTKPAVQNWPDSMREMLIPSPGRCIISADFSALELRISVLLAGQEDLIEAFVGGKDIHSMFAEVYFTDAWERASAPQRKLLRKNSKPVTFGDIYRAGAKTLYENVRKDVPEITLREVEIMQARKRAKYQNVNAYSAYVTEIANRTFELRTPWLGRRRRWPLGGVTDNEATNHPIQGGAADIVDAATIRWMQLLERKGDYHTRVWPILQIHDDLRAEVSIDYAETAIRDLVASMRCSKRLVSPITGKSYEMPFEVEAKMGPNHLALKEIEIS